MIAYMQKWIIVQMFSAESFNYDMRDFSPKTEKFYHYVEIYVANLQQVVYIILERAHHARCQRWNQRTMVGPFFMEAKCLTL